MAGERDMQRGVGQAVGAPKRIPISTAKAVANLHPHLRQVILVAWDGSRTHVVTYGRSVEECDQAAIGGDRVKAALGWPASLQGAAPSRVKALQRRVTESAATIEALVDACARYLETAARESVLDEYPPDELLRRLARDLRDGAWREHAADCAAKEPSR